MLVFSIVIKNQLYFKKIEEMLEFKSSKNQFLRCAKNLMEYKKVQLHSMEGREREKGPKVATENWT